MSADRACVCAGAKLKSPSIYARTKAEVEWGLLRQFPEADYAAIDYFWAGCSFFNRFGQMPCSHQPHLSKIRWPVYVGDVADAVLAALTKEEARGQIYQQRSADIQFADLMRFTLTCVGRSDCLCQFPFGC